MPQNVNCDLLQAMVEGRIVPVTDDHEILLRLGPRSDVIGLAFHSPVFCAGAYVYLYISRRGLDASVEWLVCSVKVVVWRAR
jgi:hypothetical protein